MQSVFCLFIAQQTPLSLSSNGRKLTGGELSSWLQESWCSDCRNAAEIVDAVFNSPALSSDVTLVTAHVGGKDEWKGNINHKYRREFAPDGVPSLVRLDLGADSTWCIAKTLVEEDCADMAKVTSLISRTDAEKKC